MKSQELIKNVRICEWNLGIEGTNDTKGFGKELWSFRGFSIEKQEEKVV